jgi:Flp pilus assembly pilin Flp
MLSLYIYMQTRLSSLIHEEDGQGLSEYALILVFVAIVAAAVLILLGKQISSVLNTVVNSL